MELGAIRGKSDVSTALQSHDQEVTRWTTAERNCVD